MADSLRPRGLVALRVLSLARRGRGGAVSGNSIERGFGFGHQHLHDFARREHFLNHHRGLTGRKSAGLDLTLKSARRIRVLSEPVADDAELFREGLDPHFELPIFPRCRRLISNHATRFPGRAAGSNRALVIDLRDSILVFLVWNRTRSGETGSCVAGKLDGYTLELAVLERGGDAFRWDVVESKPIR